MDRADEIRLAMKPLLTAGQLDVSALTSTPSVVADYLAYYNLDFASCDSSLKQFSGTFVSGKYTLVGQFFVPENYTAVVTCLHGYLTHSGLYSNLLEYLTQQGYAVAVYDLPGHGLSTGKRGDIGDFIEYTQALNDFTEYVVGNLHGPYYLLGFSTGAAVAFDYVLRANNKLYSKFVLAAPLVHNFAWKWSVIGSAVYKPLIKAVPRVPRRNSSDMEFVRFNHHDDYLQLKEVPLNWVDALQRWNQGIDASIPVDAKVLVVQGTKDTVIDYKYNMEFIKQKLPEAKIVYIEGARHEIFNESRPMRTQAFEEIENYFNS